MSYKIIVPDTSTMTADLKQKPKVGYELDAKAIGGMIVFDLGNNGRFKVAPEDEHYFKAAVRCVFAKFHHDELDDIAESLFATDMNLNHVDDALWDMIPEWLRNQYRDMARELERDTKYLQGEPIPVSTDKTITQIASDAYVQGFVTGRLKPPTEIEIDAALRYLNNNVLIRQGITHITVKYALADMCREMRYALTKRTTN